MRIMDTNAREAKGRNTHIIWSWFLGDADDIVKRVRFRGRQRWISRD